MDKLNNINNIKSSIRHKSVSQDLIHIHKKFNTMIEQPTNEVRLPQGEYYLPSNSSNYVSENSLQLYINGILQTNGINFEEVRDEENINVCVGIRIPDELLLPGDYVIMEWTNMAKGGTF